MNNIEKQISKLRDVVYDLDFTYKIDILELIRNQKKYPTSNSYSNSKKEVANYYFKQLENLLNKINEFEAIYEHIKNGDIT